MKTFVAIAVPPATEKHCRYFEQEQIAAAFTEWERRYREEPDRFQSEASKLLKETPETYGEACAPYFIQLLIETSGGAQ